MNIDLFYRRIRIDPALGDAALYRDVAGVARAVYREALAAASARRAVRFDAHHFLVAFGVCVVADSGVLDHLSRASASRENERRK